MILQPIVEMLNGFSLLELIGARYSKTEHRVDIKGINLISLFECDNCIIVLIILLIELSHKSPSLSVFWCLLYFSLQANDGFLRFSIFNKLFGDGQSISVTLHVFIFSLEWNHILLRHYFLLPLLSPLVCKLRIELLVHILLLPLLHHIIDYT